MTLVSQSLSLSTSLEAIFSNFPRKTKKRDCVYTKQSRIIKKNNFYDFVLTSVKVESIEIPRPGRVLNLRLLILKGSVGLRLSSGIPMGMRLLKSSKVLSRHTLMSGSWATQLFRLFANWSFWPKANCNEARMTKKVDFIVMMLMVVMVVWTHLHFYTINWLLEVVEKIFKDLWKKNSI